MPFLHRLRAPEGRARRVTWQKGLVVCALLAFNAALALPAARVSWEPGAPPHAVSGFAVMMTSALYYPSNGLLLVGPRGAWIVRQFRGPTVQRLFTWAHVASLLFVAAAPLVLRHTNPLLATSPSSAALEMSLAIGFYVWVAAHALMTVALALPVWGAAAAQRDARQELRLLHDKWVRGADPHGAPAGADPDPADELDPFVDGPTLDSETR